jgi:hypothetical protein
MKHELAEIAAVHGLAAGAVLAFFSLVVVVQFVATAFV